MITYIDTTLEIKLENDFHMRADTTSLIYALLFLGYLPTSLYIHHVFDNPRVPATLLMAVAFIVTGLANFFVGPSHILSSLIPNKLGIVGFGLFISGIGDAVTSIGAYQEMLQPFEEKIKIEKKDDIDREELTDRLSGLYNAGLSLGTIMGPMLGSYVMIAFDSFRICSDFFSILTVVFGLLILLVVDIPSRLKKNTNSKT